MLTTERRIAALESSASDNGLKIVIVLDGETQAEALKRLDLSDAKRVVYLTPLDALL